VSAGRELLLMRHAKSAWDSGARSDFDRPLAGRGRRDAPRIARWLAAEELEPEHAVASPAARAAETATLVATELGVDPDEITFDGALYDASVTALLGALADVPESARRVLLVAHNPGLDELVVHLGGEVPPLSATGKLMTTAAVARFAMPDRWDQLPRGCAELLGLVRPKEL